MKMMLGGRGCARRTAAAAALPRNVRRERGIVESSYYQSLSSVTFCHGHKNCCYNPRMLRTPMPVLSALALLLLPVCPAQQQASTAANAPKEGATAPNERGRILGIG